MLRSSPGQTEQEGLSVNLGIDPGPQRQADLRRRSFTRCSSEKPFTVKTRETAESWVGWFGVQMPPGLNRLVLPVSVDA